MYQDWQWTPVFPQPSFSSGAGSNLLWGGDKASGGNNGKQGRAAGSHMLPAQYLTIGPMQAEVIIWEVFGITTIVLSVPDSQKIKNYPH